MFCNYLETRKGSKFSADTTERTTEEFLCQIQRACDTSRLGMHHYKEKVNLVLNNSVVKIQQEITAYNNEKDKVWNGKVPDSAWEDFKKWFKSTYGNVLNAEKGESDYDRIKMQTNEDLVAYHTRFSRTRMRATVDDMEIDTDKAAKRKLFLSYPQNLIKEIKRRFHDIEVRKQWTLQQLKDIATRVASDEGLYQTGTSKSHLTLLADTAEKRKSFYADGKCYNCGEKGHVANNCPHKEEVAVNAGKKKAGNTRRGYKRKNTTATVGSKKKSKNDAVAATKKKENKKLLALAKHGEVLAAEFNRRKEQSASDKSRSGNDEEGALNDAVTDKSAPSLSKKLLAALKAFKKK